VGGKKRRLGGKWGLRGGHKPGVMGGSAFVERRQNHGDRAGEGGKKHDGFAGAV